ncbi:MAG: DUF1667 domain-containing protein [Clostridia bacterium]|nr:DUF1667 domain-containing protein [Clostridia bacterium]
MNRELTCIVCPMGCRLTVELNGKEVVSVSGNTCKRGEDYARSECTNPVRVITTTVRTKSGKILPVKTDKPVPKELMTECMRLINNLCPDCDGEIAMGKIICENILNTGANIIAAGK